MYMQGFDEWNNSVLYIDDDDDDRIIEYNIFTKRKSVIFEGNQYITGYIWSNKEKLVVYNNDCNFYEFAWNGKIIKTHIRFNEMFGFVWFNDLLMICFTYKGAGYSAYTSNGLLYQEFGNTTFTVSDSGKKILLRSDKYLQIKEPIMNINKLFDDCFYIDGKNISIDHTLYEYVWIYDQLIVLTYFNKEDIKIYNVDTMKSLLLFKSYIDIFEAGDYMVIQFDGFIEIYDIRTFTFIRVVMFKDTFVYFHNHLKLLVTCEFEYYVINKLGELCRVNLGNNYVKDTMTCPKYQNHVMDIILLNNVLFHNVPNEILCIELYYQILHCSS